MVSQELIDRTVADLESEITTMLERSKARAQTGGYLAIRSEEPPSSRFQRDCTLAAALAYQVVCVRGENPHVGEFLAAHLRRPQARKVRYDDFAAMFAGVTTYRLLAADGAAGRMEDDPVLYDAARRLHVHFWEFCNGRTVALADCPPAPEPHKCVQGVYSLMRQTRQ